MLDDKKVITLIEEINTDLKKLVDKTWEEYQKNKQIFMYLVFRCDCGRVLVAREEQKTRKCPCGKVVKVKGRRLLCKVEDIREVPIVVQELQSEIYNNTGFVTADNYYTEEKRWF